MIPEQLDLFGGPPRPPKKIREENIPALPVEEAPQMPVVSDDDFHLPEPVTALLEPVEEVVDFGTSMEVEQTPTLQEQVAAPERTDSIAVDSSDNRDARLSEVIASMEPAEEAPQVALPVAVADDLSFETLLEVEAIDNEPLPIVAAAEIEVGEEPASTTAGESFGSPDGFNIPPDELLYKRQYYSMRETGAMFGISHSMLRYWENEFEVLQPRKNKKGDRYFRPIDIKNLQLIYHLLKVRKFTIEGAREYLRQHHKALDNFELIQRLEKVKMFLQELKAHL